MASSFWMQTSCLKRHGSSSSAFTRVWHLTVNFWHRRKHSHIYIGELGDSRRFQSTNQINAFIGIDLRHYESGNFLAKEHITKRGNPYARKILFKCIHNIASASHTNPCHIANFYEKRKRQSTIASTKPHAIASIHRLIRTMYYLITHNKLYDYSLTQNR